jgi:multiple sugar transport system substrate-binding protein
MSLTIRKGLTMKNVVTKGNKSRIVLGLLVLFCSLLTSCDSAGENDDNDLLYWSANDAQEVEFARQVISAWNKEHSEQQIKLQPVPEGQSSEEIILAAVVGKTTPDIYANMWQGDVEFFAQAKVLVPFDTLEGFLEFIYQRCDSAIIKEITSSDGHIYQIPWKINPIMMIYNKQVVEKIGGIPRTYSEYFEACKKYQKDNDGDGYVDQWFGYTNVRPIWHELRFNFYLLYLAASDGASLVKNNKAVFNNKHALEVFRFFEELYAQNYFTQDRLDSGQDPFLSGKIATKFTGPWEIAHLEKFKPEGFDYAYAPVPVPDDHQGPVYTYGDPKNIVIFNTCKNPLLAWRFLKFLISDENDLLFLKLSSQIPPRKDLLINPLFVEVFTQNEKLAPFANQARYIKGVDSNEVIKEVFDIITQEYQSSVIYGVKSPEEALRDAAKAVDVLLLNM